MMMQLAEVRERLQQKAASEESPFATRLETRCTGVNG